MTRSLFFFLLAAMWSAWFASQRTSAQAPPPTSWPPLRAHPQNPAIFEFRGQPTLLLTHAEHYSSVVNRNFDYRAYLDVLKRDGMNLTRVFLAGFRAALPSPSGDPLDVRPEHYLQPWRRVEDPGQTALDGLGKWDFGNWDEEYFTRLRDFTRAAGERGIVVEFTFFCCYYNNDAQWAASPFHPANNIQGTGPANRYDCFRLADPALLAVQEALVRRVVRELNGFDHIYYELQNEPYWNEPLVGDEREAEFHNAILARLRDEEAGLPQRHLVAHNFPQQSAALSDDFDIINVHYPAAVKGTPLYGAETLLEQDSGRGKLLAMDETSAPGATANRLEAWMFILGGGGVYNGLDVWTWVYNEADPGGDNETGRGLRAAVRRLRNHAGDLHLTALRRDRSWLTGQGLASGSTTQAMSSPGQQYVAYFHHGGRGKKSYYDPIDSSVHIAAPEVTLEAGTWRVQWTRPADLDVLLIEEFTHDGGTRALLPVSYREDVALRIDRTGADDRTPPPIPRDLEAVARADGGIGLGWTAVRSADLAAYRVYRATDADPVPAEFVRVAEIPVGNEAFDDDQTLLGAIHRYRVSSVDRNGNESIPSSEAVIIAALDNLPFGNTPVMLPAAIEAEDFDRGGEGVACHDLTPGNDGGAYRPAEPVDLATGVGGADGVQVIDATTGEWLEYTVAAAEAGAFLPAVRIASTGPGLTLRLERAGIDLTGPVEISDTGGAGNWTTLALPKIDLAAGHHVLRLALAGDPAQPVACSLDRITFERTSRTGPTARAGDDQQRIDEDHDGVEAVMLDGTACLPGDAPITTHVWSLADTPLGNGVLLETMLPVGTHVITLTVIDAAGLIDRDELFVTVTAGGFTNGGFENHFAGWQSSGHVATYDGPPYAAAEGSRLVAFNASNLPANGVLSQTFATRPGQAYRLEFQIGVLAWNRNRQELALELTGHSRLLAETIAIQGQGGGSLQWQPMQFDFLADSAATTLILRDRSPVTLSIDLLVDGVAIEPRIQRQLRVESTPLPGVFIALDPADDHGMGAGLTPMLREYPDGTRVLLGAPARLDDLFFLGWTSDTGDPPVPEPTMAVRMDRDQSWTAVYDETAPRILVQPGDAVASIGATAVFTVSAEGSGALRHQWKFNGTELDGADQPTLVITATDETVEGDYEVVVTNALGSVTSRSASLKLARVALANGGFEQGLAGWNRSGNAEYQESPPYLASEGLRMLSFNQGDSSPGGEVWQLAGCTPGLTHQLNFDLGVLAYNTLRQSLQVVVSEGTSTLASQVFHIDGAGGGNVRWQARSLRFTPLSANVKILLRDVSTSTKAIDLLVDRLTLAVVDNPPAPDGLPANGSFEQGTSGWLTSGNLRVLEAGAGLCPDGVRRIDFNSGNSNPDGQLTQRIATRPGARYRVSLQLGVLAYNTAWQSLHARIEDSAAVTFAMQGSGNGTTRWESREFEFTAPADSALLTLRDVSASTKGIDLLLDAVSITLVEANPRSTSAVHLAPAPAARPAITRRTGQVELELMASGPGRHELQQSPDMLRWEVVAALKTDGAGPLRFADIPADTPRMFYRLVRIDPAAGPPEADAEP